MTGKELTKVIYKPDSQSTDEFTIIVNPEEYKKYSEGDTTIPLAEVVDSFDVFYSNQGSQGILGKASNQQLDSIFGTHKDVEVVQKMLELGNSKEGHGIKNFTFNTNAAKGSAVIDNKGKGLSGI